MVVLVMVFLMTLSFSRWFVNDCVTTLWKPPGTHHEKSQSRTSSHVFYVKRTPSRSFCRLPASRIAIQRRPVSSQPARCHWLIRRLTEIGRASCRERG